jgi:hypothetical protein
MAGTAYAAGAGRIVANEFASMIRPYDQRHAGRLAWLAQRTRRVPGE